MKLANLKRSPAEKKEREKALEKPAVAGHDNDYDYGTRLNLSHEHLEKMGVEELPKLGAKLNLSGHGHVLHSEETLRDGKKERRLELQVSHLGMEPRRSDKSIRSELEEAAEKTKEYEDGAAKAKK